MEDNLNNLFYRRQFLLTKKKITTLKTGESFILEMIMFYMLIQI